MAIEERRQSRTIAERVRVAIPLVIVWTIGCVVMAVVASQPATRTSEMLMDPTFTVGAKWYTGLISNLGILTWTVGAAAAFAGSWLCLLGARTNAGRFLRLGGIVGTVLLMDDLFMFHAILMPSELGIPKFLGQTIIGACVLGWAWMSRREIARTHFHLLVASGAGLAISYVVDSRFAPLPGDGWNIVEDGAKFLGVLAWATYFIVTTRDISRSVFVDALLTWPDEAYEAVYEDLEAEAAAAADASAASADSTAGSVGGSVGETSEIRSAADLLADVPAPQTAPVALGDEFDADRHAHH
ncbi:MAG: hypothetical protein GX868_13835 [Actinobacteria bacterium]|nr:hypothetical protein [Actinomycetota bacterium]